MSPRHALRACAALLLAAALAATADAHGFMNYPNIRGSLVKGQYVPRGVPRLDEKDVNKDHWAHFPAGDKNPFPGSGHRSQKRAAGPRGWTPFEPLKPGFIWRAGVCGDMKTDRPQAHLRGGKYYHGALITGTYRQAATIEVALSIIAHHNGFMELHVCDVDKCGGDIGERCFREGHCHQLQRDPDASCDSGWSRKCGPIDRNHTGRWYLPCSTVPEKSWEVFGPKAIRYRLPPNLSCEHCVLQWFWSAANTCNPPGLVEYYDGPDRPKSWGQCPGQGGARGGIARNQRPCDSKYLPEEYLDCADIRILPLDPGEVKGLSADTLPVPAPPSPTPSPIPSMSNTPRPSPIPSMSNTPRPSPIPSKSNTPRPSPIPSMSNTPRPSPIPSKSNTPRPSPVPSKSNTPRPSPNPSKSNTPRQSDEPRRALNPASTPDTSSVPSASPSLEPVSALEFDLYSTTAEPDYSPEESPEESAEMSPELFWSPEASEESLQFGPLEPHPRNGVIKDLILVADGTDLGSVVNGQVIDISGHKNVAFKVITTRNVKKVDFYVDGEKVWTDYYMDYFMFGNSKTSPFYWKEPPLDIWTEVKIVTEGEEDVVNIMFTA